ncbi:uncharacterized protein [Haliotis asinina]|uniref:uncharacterized protein n=1 Tax=Haliotis asinina TaxID=109174 RepID=UPI0035318809
MSQKQWHAAVVLCMTPEVVYNKLAPLPIAQVRCDKFYSVMSWCNIPSMLFFLVISRSFQSAPVTKRTLFFRRPDLDGRLVHNWTTVRPSSSVWECADICSADGDCLSVTFVRMSLSEGCVLYQRSVSTTDDFTISPSAIGFGVCPFGFSMMTSWCIKVVTDKMNMLSARTHCRDHNADLITLETQTEIGEFRDFMVANDYGYSHEFIWCGVSDVNGGWQWINGKTLSSTSDVWCSNEPNLSSERCAAVHFDCLRDVHCHTEQRFVCVIHF